MRNQDFEVKEKIEKLAVNTIRILCAEGVQKANSGHPGMPMGMADVAYVLWTKFLKFNPKDPDWINRDRFILSAGHGSMLLYTMLYLSGYDVTLDDLKSFRQLNSRTPGHPEYGCLPGVETTTGPLGQGFANGIGMAIASKMLAERYNTEEFKIFGNHYIYAIVSDGDLMEGIASEAASYAGYLGLGNIIYIYDDNHITIEGNTELTFSEDVAKRFEAYGWHTVKIDGQDHTQIYNAISEGQKEKDRPTLILARTTIGYGSPNKANTAGVHGSPLGEEELQLTKKNLGWNYQESFFVPPEVKQIFDKRINELKAEYEIWQKQFVEWKSKYPELAKKFIKALHKELPSNLEKLLFTEDLLKENATRSLSSQVIQKIADYIPFVVGGSADLAPSTSTFMKKYESISKGKFGGKNFHFGIREHGMGGILNGLSLYGGFIPFGATFLVFSDYMRGSIRLAALSKLQVIYVFTHDSIFLGEDGPTHQPIEHLAALRAIPNLIVIRPADGYETLAAWSYALNNKSGPTAIILTRQKVGTVTRNLDFNYELFYKGGYIAVKEKENLPELVLAASGSELSLATETAKLLHDKFSVRVVSVPSLDLLKEQSKEYLQDLIPSTSKVVVIEAAITQGWGDLIRNEILRIDLNDFGKSAPYKILADYYGFTPQKAANKIFDWLKLTN
ncbi:transketolase [Melioribacteraceae bacterium 4301-Me]|uniref:transketolase n=1 Tax=Pyranulibacter aquaticus TaxID=3163344 RepID=UPI00359530E2